MKKILALLLAVLMVASFAACKTDTSEEPESSKPAESMDPLKEWPSIPAGTVLQFWHAMGGANGAALDLVVAKFNEENEFGITVEATFQGGYTDLHTKLVSALQG
ncbi:MAG: ABC transporter substrate-binding protein, partial [Clostridia bacterium]|nr:ABC transporter substrate-binding protein [Clostridia bacterium]